MVLRVFKNVSNSNIQVEYHSIRYNSFLQPLSLQTALTSISYHVSHVLMYLGCKWERNLCQSQWLLETVRYSWLHSKHLEYKEDLKLMAHKNSEIRYINKWRSQWPHGLRHRSTAAWLLWSWVRIPPGHGCLSVVCCQIEVSATGWSLV
jgi:hypothetical protein